MSRLKPFFSYFGSKYRIAPKYPDPRHRLIVEPFAGAAGYAATHPHHDVLLIDADERIAGAWSYLIGATPDEVRRLPLWDGWESVDDLTSIPQEARWLIGYWLNKGATGTKKPSAWMRSGKYPDQFWGEAIRERIASQVDAIKHWRVIHGDYTQAPDVAATWFIDPPYEVAGTYRQRPDDFAALGRWCQEREGQVMVCENVGADWLPFRPFIDAKATSGGARAGVSREAIWTKDDEGVLFS